MMQLQLILIRHGHAEDSIGMKDFDRPLSTQGKDQANAIGIWLQQQNIIPDLIMYSNAKRTTTTKDCIYKHIAHENIRTISNPNLYLCNSEKITEELASIPDNDLKTVILIGHNNGLSDFFNQITHQPIYHNFSTCETAIVRLELNNWQDIYQCHATVVSIQKPNNTNL